ncbi:hypothetical protein SAMN05421877_101215 [Sphingobacterium lactis]|uniref:Uncharacterized protein n=1 Tax=Sphingobacterium lactis TaxID=797291 RepID=A0A1H5SBS7_9SPHI|nr:hypothetical protein SAMN05421877_101215 [Sphingobacterium lactis]
MLNRYSTFFNELTIWASGIRSIYSLSHLPPQKKGPFPLEKILYDIMQGKIRYFLSTLSFPGPITANAT